MTVLRRWGLIAAAAFAALVWLAPVSTSAHEKAPAGPKQLKGKAGCISQGGKGGCTKARLLAGANQVVASRDGRNVYVGTTKVAIVVLARNRKTGALTQLKGAKGCVTEGGSGGCTKAKGFARGFDRIVLTPDGKQLYVVVNWAVLVFSRNPSTGVLKQLTPCIAGSESPLAAGCARPRPPIGIPRSIAFTADGKTAAVTEMYGSPSPSAQRHGVEFFHRDPASGALAQLPGATGCVEANGNDGCIKGDSTSLFDLADVALDPGGSFFVTTSGVNTMRSFTRSAAGVIAPAACVQFGSIYLLPCALGRNARPVYGLTLAAGSHILYGAGSGGIGVFRLAGGSLSGQLPGPTGCIGNGKGDCPTPRLPAASAPVAIALSPNGKYLYGAAIEGLLTFKRVAGGGIVQLAGGAGCVADTARKSPTCSRTGRALDGSYAVAASADGKNVYVGSTTSGAVAVFSAPR